MLQSLKPSPKNLLLRSLLLPSLISSNPLSTSSAAAASAASFPISFTRFVDPNPELDRHYAAISAAFKDWFRSGSAPLEPLNAIYAALASSPDDSSLSHAFSRLHLRLSEDLILRVLRHTPFPPSDTDSNTASYDDLLLLRLKFFDWSGRQSGYQHSRSAYHAIFMLLSRAGLVSVVLDWLHLFSSSSCRNFSRHSFLTVDGAASTATTARFHDTLVVGYAVAGRPERALHLFARMRFRGLDLDAFSYHVLINALVEASLFDFADAVFTQIEARGLAGPITACIRIKSLCSQSRLTEATLYLRDLMASVSCDQDRRAFNQQAVGTLVRALCRKRKFEEAHGLVEEFATAGAYGVWVTNLLDARKLDSAIEFLESKRVSEDYIAESSHYSRLLRMLMSKNRLEEVYDMLVEMMERGIPPNRATMNAALCFFCKAGMVDIAVQLYRSRMDLGISPNSWVYEHLINALCRDGCTDKACVVLEEALQQGYFPGKQTFNIIASVLCEEGKLDKMEKLLEDALHRKMKPMSATFARYLSALCKSGDVKKACLVPHMVSREVSRLYRYKSTYTSLIHAFIMTKRLDKLPQLIIEMQEQGHSPSRSIYRDVVRSLCEMNMFHLVIDLLNKQLELKEPDPRTSYNYFIEAAGHAKKPEMANELHNMMVTSGIEPNLDTEILLMQSYLKSKRIGDAVIFFQHLIDKRQPSTKLYNIFISGLCEAGKLEQAVEYWRKAREKQLIPSLACYEDLVLGLCTYNDYRTAVKVLEDFTKTGRPFSTFLCNVLLLHTLKGQELLRACLRSREVTGDAELDGEGKVVIGSGQLMLGNLMATFAGGIRMEENIDNLDEVVEKFFPLNTFTYNMLLRGLTMTGKVDSACNLFRKMCKKGYEPNRFTFDIIVHGFCKRRKRKDAERWMEEMHRHGFYPTWYTMRLYNNIP